MQGHAQLPGETGVVGDIGGTNVRFARIGSGATLDQVKTLAVDDYPGPAEALLAYLSQTDGPMPVAAAIGIANPIVGDRVQMTNHFWNFSIEEMRRQVGLERLLFVNDFTALALSLSELQGHEREQIGGGLAQPRAAIGVIGPGTGLGVSGLLPTPNGYVPIEGEGGHVTLSGQSEEERAVIAALSQLFAHVSAERVLSGPGLENLYQALGHVRGHTTEHLSANDISTRALGNEDALCVDTLNMFCALLGTQAANLALMLGARGGIYIGGGIVPKLGSGSTSFFAHSPFRQRFETKGRFSDYLSRIPTWVITAPYPALIGAATLLQGDR